MNARTFGLGLFVVALVAACSGTSATPSGSAAASAISGATASTGTSASASASGSSASAPSATATATATAVASSGDGSACTFMSDSDALTLFSGAGKAQKTFVDTAAGSVTSCRWGAPLGQQNSVILVVDRLKIAPAIAGAKAAIAKLITEQISGLGDDGGFALKHADSVEVVFIKGPTTVLLTVSVAGVDADAVAAMAMKIAATL